MLATEYAKYFDIAPQGEDESANDFRNRVAGKLRDMGNIIEAHEVAQDARYEDNDNVMTGIVGAIAQAMQGKDYGRTGYQQLGDDMAAGTIAQNPKSEQDVMMALLSVMMFG